MTIVCVIFRVKKDSPPTKIRSEDLSEAIGEQSAENNCKDFFLSPPNSNPNDNADYTVTRLNKYFR